MFSIFKEEFLGYKIINGNVFCVNAYEEYTNIFNKKFYTLLNKYSIISWLVILCMK